MLTQKATWRLGATLAIGAVLGTGCATAQAPGGVPSSRPVPASQPDGGSASGDRYEPPGQLPYSEGDGPAVPVFAGEIHPLDSATRAAMSFSWHEGCPVALDDLRLLTLKYWGFDGRVHTGQLIVHEDVSRDVADVFRTLFDARFPIRRIRLVDEYGGDDDRSMAANNTSAFNCREATGHPDVWSEHSYGRAIDINPLNNPYVASDGTVLPPHGAPFADRSRQAKGMIHEGDVVVEAFASIGWEWGGAWSSIKDYQHFSVTGR